MSENRIEIGPYDYIELFFKRAALVVSMDNNGKSNVMAVLWRTIGELWGIPVITIAVAPSRYSFELLTKGMKEFTLNVPSEKNEGAVDVCGSLSGRNTDKFKEAGLNIIKGKKTKVPTIENCVLSYECKIVHSCTSGKITSHHLFFGEILAAYASRDVEK